MKLVVLICNRLIKLLAHTTKLLSYPFHFLFPRVRFRLPSSAPAWPRRRNGGQIPPVIWQTNFTDRVTLPVYLNYLFNRLMSPGFEYRYVSTEARLDFIREHFPGPVLACYLRLKNGAAQADLWRLLVLQKEGGVYMDIDAHLVWPLPWLLPRGLGSLYIRTRQDRYTNWFIASRPDNPELEAIIAEVVGNVRKGEFELVYDLTGPPTMDAGLADYAVASRSFRYTCVQGSFTNEHFQYLDRPGGKWTRARREDVLVDDAERDRR